MWPWSGPGRQGWPPAVLQQAGLEILIVEAAAEVGKQPSCWTALGVGRAPPNAPPSDDADRAVRNPSRSEMLVCAVIGSGNPVPTASASPRGTIRDDRSVRA
jgi:hypothetical protein